MPPTLPSGWTQWPLPAPEFTEKTYPTWPARPFLVAKLLTPALLATAADKSRWENEVGVIFVSSFAAETYHEKRVCIDMESLDYHRPKLSIHGYGLSKVGAWAYGVEF
ncbi:hypothetical protein DL768_002913 [Monosporascus sp. mg162]|nr:hypothetical protein DL768_002913 [Monosporascus sp. mg162]